MRVLNSGLAQRQRLLVTLQSNSGFVKEMLKLSDVVADSQTCNPID